jgi:hypothetical protein
MVVDLALVADVLPERAGIAKDLGAGGIRQDHTPEPVARTHPT